LLDVTRPRLTGHTDQIICNAIIQPLSQLSALMDRETLELEKI